MPIHSWEIADSNVCQSHQLREANHFSKPLPDTPHHRRDSMVAMGCRLLLLLLPSILTMRSPIISTVVVPSVVSMMPSVGPTLIVIIIVVIIAVLISSMLAIALGAPLVIVVSTSSPALLLLLLLLLRTLLPRLLSAAIPVFWKFCFPLVREIQSVWFLSIGDICQHAC